MYSYNLALHFNSIAQKFAKNTALHYADKNITYELLHKLSMQCMVWLCDNKHKKNDVIAIGNTKNHLSYAMMLACLQLGMPYINIDVNSPLERTKRIFKVAQPSALFFDDINFKEEMQNLAKTFQIPAFYLEEKALPQLNGEYKNQLAELIKQIDGASIAYIMYTSGSTGIPKGVAVTHENLSHFIAWGKDCFNIQTKDRFAQLSPMYFDNSVFDFYIALFSGASLVPINKDLLAMPYELIKHIDTMQCTIWFSVPSLLMYLMTMKAFSIAPLNSLRSFSFGGEGYPKVELKKLYDMFHTQAKLVNVYGPTECTCICSAHTITDKDFISMDGLPTLGKLNQNFDYMIVDETGKECSQGELLLLGPNVAAGYFNDPERTKQAFTVLQTAHRFGKSLYRTGDLVREEDGMLFFIGRKDNQIKHMGYRIELEEIESALISHENIDQVAVIYKKENTAYGKIIAYCASKSDIDESVIKKYVEKILPSYMLPHKIYILDFLPVNPNGKVDKKGLLEKYENN